MSKRHRGTAPKYAWAPRALKDYWSLYGREYGELWNEAEDIRQEMEHEQRTAQLGDEFEGFSGVREQH